MVHLEVARPLRALMLISLVASCRSLSAQVPSADDSLDATDSPQPAIHATRLDYSKFEVPEAVTVITQEDIRAAGYLEVSEIFRSVPGFRIVKIGDESRISYHGTIVQQNRRMLVTIDGRSVLIGDGQYIEFDRLPIDLEDISRVTVARGPNGAAYGDNAFLASIDFETIGRDDPRGISVRAGGGHSDRRKAGIAINELIHGYDVQFTAGAERDGGYDYYDSNGTPRDDGKEIQRAKLTLEREINQGSRWRLDASAYDSQNKTGVQIIEFTGEQTNRGEFIALSNEREIGERSRLDLFVSHNRQREQMRQFGCYTPEAIAGVQMIITDPVIQAQTLAPALFVPGLLGTSLENTCFFLDLGIHSERSELEIEWESRRGAWRYLVGASAADTHASSYQYFAGRAQDQRSYRLFGETAIALADLHASLGAMAQDASNVDGIQFAWRGALNWQFQPNQALRYTYAKGFRIPALVETEPQWTGAFFFGRRGEAPSTYQFSLPLPPVTSGARLKPETIESYSVGYFGTFFRSSTTLDAKVFQETIRDRVQSDLFYFSPPAFNADGFHLTGAELELAMRLSGRWRLSGQYSYLDNDARTAIERGLHGRHGASLLTTYRPVAGHAITLAYYGNSTISGHSYDRYDLVYNYQQRFGDRHFRSQLILQHHVGGVDGIRGDVPLLANEGHFAHLNQAFVLLELTF